MWTFVRDQFFSLKKKHNKFSFNISGSFTHSTYEILTPCQDLEKTTGLIPR